MCLPVHSLTSPYWRGYLHSTERGVIQPASGGLSLSYHSAEHGPCDCPPSSLPCWEDHAGGDGWGPREEPPTLALDNGFEEPKWIQKTLAFSSKTLSIEPSWPWPPRHGHPTGPASPARRKRGLQACLVGKTDQLLGLPRGRSRARSLGCLLGGEVLKGVSQWAGHVALTVFPLLCVWPGARNGPVLSGPGGLSAEAECDHGDSCTHDPTDCATAL